MDGLHDDSPWVLIFDTMAHVEWIWKEGFHLVLIVSTVAIFYSFAGPSRLDLLWNLALLAHLNRSALAFYIYPAVGYVPILCLCFVAAITCYLASVFRRSDTDIWQGPGKPYLIPCRTTHTRLFPKKHFFSYSYLTIGIPVGFNGCVNGMIEVDEQQSSTFRGMFQFAKFFLQSWYRIQASDHFQRGHNELGLRGKLDNFLQFEDVDPTDFPYAYLVTAPRFAGYHFNQVSFWYLYSRDKILSAIVFEANNTFDERRPYLVVRDFTTESKHVAPGLWPRFKGSRIKDFYVSPFNSRNGYYSVLASDPLGPGIDEFHGIDVTITLNSSKGHPKLVARLFSEGQAVDPAVLSLFSRFTFLARWFWVGFATLPRIVKEAIVLLYRRKLRVFDRPEPLIGTLGRHATSVEQRLELCFRKYLEFLVSQSKKPISLKFYTSGLLPVIEATWTSSFGTESQIEDILELRILTPAFYSRFIQYVDSLDAITAELNQHKTIWAKKPELLAGVFVKINIETRSLSFLDYVFAGLVKYLRQRLPKIPPTVVMKVKGVDMSSMDAYMMLYEDGKLKKQYQWAVAQQLVADCYLMGRVDFLEQVTTVVRIGIAWACASSLTQITKGAYI